MEEQQKAFPAGKGPQKRNINIIHRINLTMQSIP
jgi:hypothetical protein